MARPGRKPGTPKTGGRKKGTPNKINATIKEAVLVAFDRVGGADYLEQLAREDPKTFVPLMLKCIPNEVQGRFETGLPLLVLQQDYVNGQVREIGSADEERQDGSDA